MINRIINKLRFFFHPKPYTDIVKYVSEKVVLYYTLKYDMVDPYEIENNNAGKKTFADLGPASSILVKYADILCNVTDIVYNEGEIFMIDETNIVDADNLMIDGNLIDRECFKKSTLKEIIKYHEKREDYELLSYYKKNPDKI